MIPAHLRRHSAHPRFAPADSACFTFSSLLSFFRCLCSTARSGFGFALLSSALTTKFKLENHDRRGRISARTKGWLKLSKLAVAQAVLSVLSVVCFYVGEELYLLPDSRTWTGASAARPLIALAIMPICFWLVMNTKNLLLEKLDAAMLADRIHAFNADARVCGFIQSVCFAYAVLNAASSPSIVAPLANGVLTSNTTGLDFDPCELINSTYVAEACEWRRSTTAGDGYVCEPEAVVPRYRSRMSACDASQALQRLHVRSSAASLFAFNVVLLLVLRLARDASRKHSDRDMVSFTSTRSQLAQRGEASGGWSRFAALVFAALALGCCPVLVSFMLLPDSGLSDGVNLLPLLRPPTSYLQLVNCVCWVLAFGCLNLHTARQLWENVKEKLGSARRSIVGRLGIHTTSDCFLSHNWGEDEQGRDNHARVKKVNDWLKDKFIETWFDEENFLPADPNMEGREAPALVLMAAAAKPW